MIVIDIQELLIICKQSWKMLHVACPQHSLTGNSTASQNACFAGTRRQLPRPGKGYERSEGQTVYLGL